MLAPWGKQPRRREGVQRLELTARPAEEATEWLQTRQDGREQQVGDGVPMCPLPPVAVACATSATSCSAQVRRQVRRLTPPASVTVHTPAWGNAKGHTGWPHTAWRCPVLRSASAARSSSSCTECASSPAAASKSSGASSCSPGRRNGDVYAQRLWHTLSRPTTAATHLQRQCLQRRLHALQAARRLVGQQV